MQFHAGLFVAIVAVVGVWWLLGSSTVGFRMRSVGANPSASRYAGMRVGATYILSMALAGGLAGLAGTANILGRSSYSLTGGYYNEVGFDAIAVALLGRASPFGVLASALLFGALRAGSGGMQGATSTPVDIIVVIDGSGTFTAATSYDVTDPTAELAAGFRIPNADDTALDGEPIVP